MTKVLEINRTTGVITWEKKLAKGEKRVRAKREAEYLSIKATYFHDLYLLALLDGFEYVGTTKRGIQGETTRAVQRYVDIAVEAFLTTRTTDIALAKENKLDEKAQASIVLLPEPESKLKKVKKVRKVAKK